MDFGSVMDLNEQQLNYRVLIFKIKRYFSPELSFHGVNSSFLGGFQRQIPRRLECTPDKFGLLGAHSSKVVNF